MKKLPEDSDLRRSAAERGRRLAVFDLAGGETLDSDSGIDLVRGRWDGKDSVAVVATPDFLSPRDSHECDLRALHEISFELSLSRDVDELCRKVVVLGRQMLGFDRLGIWFNDPAEPSWIMGCWGTDERGEPRDEHGWRLERKRGELPDSFYDGRVSLFYDSDVIRRGDDGRVLGSGARLVAPIWDGHSLIGEFGVDDFLNHRGFSPEKREVFSIFARLVSHLVSLKRAEAELKQLASTDSLTGAVNRRTALIILEKHLGQCRRSGSPLTICLADLDGLKLVNDAYGHSAGDQYIRRASAVLTGAVRASDTVGRIGGDEFLVVLPDCRGDLVAGIMERVNAELAAGAQAGGYVPRMSWGIASPAELGKGNWSDKIDVQRCIDMLLELADQRMYDDKRTKGASRTGAHGAAQVAAHGSPRGAERMAL
jgi:diguanylate cyclase (GGDEF)-like protein